MDSGTDCPAFSALKGAEKGSAIFCLYGWWNGRERLGARQPKDMARYSWKGVNVASLWFFGYKTICDSNHVQCTRKGVILPKGIQVWLGQEGPSLVFGVIYGGDDCLFLEATEVTSRERQKGISEVRLDECYNESAINCTWKLWSNIGYRESSIGGRNHWTVTAENIYMFINRCITILRKNSY